jgi:tetrahydromethanopterin S-methyltransferase subunit A
VQKCWACRCLSSSIATIEKAIPRGHRSHELDKAIEAAKETVQPPEIDCRGCDVCYPAIALNELAEIVDPEDLEMDVCPAIETAPRTGWPPLAGNYSVLGYQRPVAICTLNSEDLWHTLARSRPQQVALVGTLKTENLGIERLIQNITADPFIRFLILCGEDSHRRVGHLPGQSLIALGANGINDRARIIGATGKRPVLKNIEPALVEHFRRSVEIIDLMGEDMPDAILSLSAQLAERSPGPCEQLEFKRAMRVQTGYIPDRMAPDPNGYFVIYPDPARGCISLEHYTNEGVLTTIIEGGTAAEVYYPAAEQKLLSRYDHACYLGRELARAEHALNTGEPYVQDAAPELESHDQSCGCSSDNCEETK